jgi:hypothetical protein
MANMLIPDDKQTIEIVEQAIRRADVARQLGGALISPQEFLNELTLLASAPDVLSLRDVLGLYDLKLVFTPGWGVSTALSTGRYTQYLILTADGFAVEQRCKGGIKNFFTSGKFGKSSLTLFQPNSDLTSEICQKAMNKGLTLAAIQELIDHVNAEVLKTTRDHPKSIKESLTFFGPSHYLRGVNQ